jgi:peptidoglycan/LPS O-acetylase OafA/YrhL
LTYPFYLLHQQVGYVALNAVGSVAHPAVVVLIVLAIGLISWATWRVIERPLQSLTRQALSGLASRVHVETASRSSAISSKS